MVLQEAVLWRQLIHPFVVPLLGVGMVSERLCLLSPWLSFGNLRQYLQQHGPCEPREIIASVLSDPVVV
jgi:serine/threonine protein kinase